MKKVGILLSVVLSILIAVLPVSAGSTRGFGSKLPANCTVPPCFDGSSDGGTWSRWYDGNSHYLELNPGDLDANETFDPTDDTGSGSWMRAQGGTFLVNFFTPQFTLVGSDASPDAAGEVRWDSVIAGMDGGGLRWFDDDSVRLIVDLETDPVDGDDDKLVAWDIDANNFYLKADADSGGATALDDITDPDAASSWTMGAHTLTLTSGTEASGGVTIANTDPDNAGDTHCLTLTTDDDYDANSILFRGINDADGGADVSWRFTGLGFYFGGGSPTQTMDGKSAHFASFIEVDGPIHAEAGIISADADPQIILDDTDGANGFWSVDAIDADDAVANFGVDDSGGDNQPYIELDGENERIEMKEDVIIEVTIDGGGATSFEIENNNNPTTAAAGDIAVDANHNMLELFGDASYSIPTMFPIYITVANQILWMLEILFPSLPTILEPAFPLYLCMQYQTMMMLTLRLKNTTLMGQVAKPM